MHLLICLKKIYIYQTFQKGISELVRQTVFKVGDINRWSLSRVVILCGQYKYQEVREKTFCIRRVER